jgi:glycosyltransferase involved in cell wall biosynthesis
LPERFLLHVGTIEPRKNLQRLMSAYAELQAEGDAGLGLVLAGKPGWLADPILAQARATPGVLLPGPVADADLPALYTLAAGVVYPTLYEGFGFPPLEALACGTPAISSNTSSLPELVEGAAILIDPQDTAALVAGLRRLLGDPTVAEQARRTGPQHAARFTWPHAARQLLELYRSLLNGPRAAGAPVVGGR